MHIDFQDETEQVTNENIDMVRQLLMLAAQKEKISENAELSVQFVDNHTIQQINRDYRGFDKPTDVISFALEETVEGEVTIVGADVPVVLGDIIISLDRAKEQAVDYDHTLERELGFLAVHGLLHLLGYDHMNKDDEVIMFQRQKDILNAYGLKR